MEYTELPLRKSYLAHMEGEAKAGGRSPWQGLFKGLFLSPAPTHCVRLPVLSQSTASLCLSQFSSYNTGVKAPLYTTTIFVKIEGNA